MTKTFRVIALALLMVMLGTSTAAASRGQPDHTVPIRGSVVGLDPGPDFGNTGCPAPPPGAVPWRFESSGTGNLAHLGKVDFVLANCTTWYPPLPPESELPEGDFRLEIDGMMTFIAANGDELVITHTAEGFFFPGSATATWTITEWVVADGDGRFEGATGSGVGNAVTNIPPPDTEIMGYTEINLSGEIAYDASNRSKRR